MSLTLEASIRVSIVRIGLALSILAVALGSGTAAGAQQESRSRAVLQDAAEAMGGLGKLQTLDNVVLTGFGQRIYFQGGGNETGDEHAPPKWQSVTDAQRTFDLQNKR